MIKQAFLLCVSSLIMAWIHPILFGSFSDHLWMIVVYVFVGYLITKSLFSLLEKGRGTGD
jgi:hypothetical protein